MDTTKKPDSKDIEKIAQNMRLSLENTYEGLKLFANSLEHSKLRSSIPQYRQMQLILINQRLWADKHGRNEFDSMWNKISEQSDNIYNAIKPYVEIMQELKKINTIKTNSVQNNSKSDPQLEKNMSLEALRMPQFFSVTKLSIMLNKEKKEIINDLEPLVKEGIVEKKGRGSSLSYRFKENNKNRQLTE